MFKGLLVITRLYVDNYIKKINSLKLIFLSYSFNLMVYFVCCIQGLSSKKLLSSTKTDNHKLNYVQPVSIVLKPLKEKLGLPRPTFWASCTFESNLIDRHIFR